MKKNSHGFTLIELLVTIAVIVIMATIAVPSFQSFIASNRQAAEFNKVLSGFHYARSEAVKRRESILVDVESSSGKWVVTVAQDVNEDKTLDVGDVVIRNIESKDGKVAVDSITVVFSPLGRLAECKNTDSLVSPCQFLVGGSKLKVNAAGNIDKAD
ncbi:GspH/FimT family pseudopilin [Halomonas fontilapidosi]|nr:GspH/FimT family pseudopilin [Halomonas fontilapidosi]